MPQSKKLQALSWKEKLGMLNLAWRTILPGFGHNGVHEIDDKVEHKDLAAIPDLTNIVQDENESDDRRYWAIRYLLMFHRETKIPLDDLLHSLGVVAHSRPDEDFYQPRRDAMKALTLLHGDGRGFGSNPRATEVLTSIAADEHSLSPLRRDALMILADPNAIHALAPEKVDSVFEALLGGLISLPSDKDVQRIQRIIVQGIRKIERVSWEDKARHLLRLLEARPALSRGDINAATLVEAITPLEGESRFVNQLSDLLIAAVAEGKDERMTGLIAELLIAVAGGDPVRAVYHINSYERAHNMSQGSLRTLRIAVGGAEVSGILRSDLKQYFQEPIFELNRYTIEMWKKIINRAQWGFVVRLTMSVIVFLIGAVLLCVSSYLMLFHNNFDIYGQGIPFAAGLASMLLVIYSGPLKDIRQSVADLGTANAAFIGYVHRVLETSHTFSFFYTKETVDFERLQKSSNIIRDAMNGTVEALNRVAKDSSEGILFKMISWRRAREHHRGKKPVSRPLSSTGSSS